MDGDGLGEETSGERQPRSPLLDGVPACLTFPEKPGLLQSCLRRAQYLAQRTHVTDTVCAFRACDGKRGCKGRGGQHLQGRPEHTLVELQKNPCHQCPRTQERQTLCMRPVPETLQGSHSVKPVRTGWEKGLGALRHIG